MSQPKCDWIGDPVPHDEPEDKEIFVWVIDPDVSRRGFDELWERDYYRMIDLVQDNLADHLESKDPEELREFGVTIKLRVRSTTVGEYREVVGD